MIDLKHLAQDPNFHELVPLLHALMNAPKATPPVKRKRMSYEEIRTAWDSGQFKSKAEMARLYSISTSTIKRAVNPGRSIDRRRLNNLPKKVTEEDSPTSGLHFGWTA